MKITDEKRKALNVILGTFFYVFAILFFIILNKFDYLHKPLSIIIAYEPYLFKAIRIYLPVFIIIVPIIIKLFYKTNFYKSVLIGIAFLILYIPFTFCMKEIIIHDVKTFTPVKWHEKKLLRGFMLADLNDDYNIKGMNIKKTAKILGKPDKIEDNIHCYVIDPKKEYCLIFEDNIVSEIKIK